MSLSKLLAPKSTPSLREAVHSTRSTISTLHPKRQTSTASSHKVVENRKFSRPPPAKEVDLSSDEDPTINDLSISKTLALATNIVPKTKNPYSINSASLKS